MSDNPLYRGYIPAFGGMRISPLHHWPRVADGWQTFRVKAHPFVCWLACWLPISPYVEGRETRYRDADMMLDHASGTILCSFAQADALRRELRARETVR